MSDQPLTNRPMAKRYSFADDKREIREQLDRWGTFLLANLIWAICSLPVITLPASTAGLFAVMSGRARGEPGELFSTFFNAARKLGLKASGLALIDLVFGGWIVLNFTIFPQMGEGNPAAIIAQSVTLFAGAMLVLANLYAWSLLVAVQMTFKELISASLKLVFAYPLWSIGVLIAAAIPVMIGLLLPQGVFVFVVMSAVAWIIAAGTWRVIRRHVDEADILTF